MTSPPARCRAPLQPARRKVAPGWLLWLALGTAALAGCAGKPREPGADNAAASDPYTLVMGGVAALEQRKPGIAIERYFDPVIAQFDALTASEPVEAYSARTPSEAMLYLARARREQREATVLPAWYAQAHYLKGYASLELGRTDEAEHWVRKALELAPFNSMYLVELGHILKLGQRWDEALDAYQRALQASRHSPNGIYRSELVVAMRGAAFSLVELGRLDEAEARFRECLAIDPGDGISRQGLQRIQQLRAAR